MITSVPHADAPSRQRAGLLVVGILLIATNLRAALTSVGPVLDDVRADLGLTATAAGVLTALPLLAFAGFSPIAPLVARRLGLERTVGLGLAVLAAGIVLRSLPVIGAIWAGTVAIGAAIAFFNVLLPSLVKRDFPDRVAQLSGSYSATQSIVAAVASGVAVPIAGESPAGWRIALGCWIGLTVIAAAFWLPQLRTSLPSRGGGDSAEAPTHRSPWRSALGWQVTLFMGLQSLVFYVMIAWLPTIERDHGVAAASAGWHLFVYLISAVVANLAAPQVMRRLPDQRLVGLLCAVLILSGVGGLLWAPDASVLWLVCAGFGAGMSLVLCLSLFSLRAVDHRQAAALSGMAQSIGYLLAACGPVLIGALRDVSGAWTLPLSVLCVLIATMGGFAFLSGRARVVG
ncbi:MFS transporter [Dactylosporangium darangshiense]|uniref:MFS transporter n=1 Tax=Dactylosporangium darangshiense TaxID=579108 RepID=A0ABP8DSG1_9ACTN